MTTEERPALTAERAGRLYKLIRFLAADASRSRVQITRRLGLDLRGFYRDLGVLRSCGVMIDVNALGYKLAEDAQAALAKLPFPDPLLSFDDALALSVGRSAAHRKMKEQIREMVGELPKRGDASRKRD